MDKSSFGIQNTPELIVKKFFVKSLYKRRYKFVDEL